jgi:phosphoribosylformylglycinamidine (FGAM) synthase PurS component
MSKYVPVKGHSGLVRDTESNALINLNAAEIEQARERKRLKLEKRQSEQNLKDKVDAMESELTEIKSMLKILINKI